MVSSMNYGGVFTFLAVLTACSSALLLVPISKSKILSHKRREEGALLADMGD